MVESVRSDLDVKFSSPLGEAFFVADASPRVPASNILLTVHGRYKSRHDAQPQTMCRPDDLPSHRLLPRRRQMLVRAFYLGDLVDVLQRHAPNGRSAPDRPAAFIYPRRLLEEVCRRRRAICERECPVGLDRDGTWGRQFCFEVCCAGVATVSIARGRVC